MFLYILFWWYYYYGICMTFENYHYIHLYVVLPNIRDGILLHTGDWTHASTGEHWTPDEDMPNSAGCIHAHPADVELIYKTLVEQLGVQVRDNPFSGKNYPYTPQGVGFIQLVD